MPTILLLANLIIAVSYFTIAALVGAQLWQTQTPSHNKLGLATFGIFLTCGLGHSVHVLSYLAALPGDANAGLIGSLICIVAQLPAPSQLPAPVHGGFANLQLSFDLLTIIPAVSFLALRSRYGLLAKGESVILGYQQTIQVQQALVDERTAALEIAHAHARELAEAHARAEQARAEAEQAALALCASERRFRLLAENARDIIYRYQLGEHPQVEYISPVVGSVLGYPPEAWYADPLLFEKIVHPEDRPLWAAIAADPRAAANPLIYRCIHANGQIVWLEQQTSVMSAGGAMPALECVARDITDRVQAEQAQRALELKLQEAQRLESIGVLAGGIAHDFNNLLTGILGHAELALHDLPAELSARSNIEPIRTAALHAAELTSQMLAYAGKGKYVIEQVDLNHVIQEMSGLLNMSVLKRCRVAYHLASDLPVLEADLAQIRQVLLNLLINAAEAIGEHDGSVTISTGDCVLTSEMLDSISYGHELQPGRFVLLEVRDTGCGMDAATLARMFDPFFSTKFTGRGLGLSAVQGIVRSHMGALQVSSMPGLGTCFRIWLPASCALPLFQPLPQKQPIAQAQGAVVLIDDEETVRAVAQHMLEYSGYTVYAFADGDAALELLRAGVPNLRGVLVDLTMPAISGEVVVGQIQKHWPGTPVVLMSGYSAADLSQQYHSLGVDSFLQKPFTLDTLQSAFQAALSRYAMPYNRRVIAPQCCGCEE